MNNNFLFNFYKTSIDFRLYLRHTFYPNNLSYLQDSLMNYVSGIADMDYSDSYEYRLKCRKNKTSDGSEYCIEIENALVNALMQTNFEKYILRDTSLSDVQKETFSKVYLDIATNLHSSSYIKTLYDISIVPINTLYKLVLVNF